MCIVNNRGIYIPEELFQDISANKTIDITIIMKVVNLMSTAYRSNTYIPQLVQASKNLAEKNV